jgi:hypothetical protein
MSRLVIGSRAELITALRAQEAPLAAAEAAARAAFDAQVAALRRALDAHVAALAARRAPLAERRREVAEELFLDALFLVAQFPGGQIAEAGKCCYAFDVRLCAGLCRATWAEEAFWSGLVRVQSGPSKVTRLMYAARQGDAARVAWLLARGTSRDAKDVHGHTALHYASWNGRTNAVRVLLAAGANVEAARYDGMRPLHAASSNHQAAAATLLLDAGAAVNALDNAGRSPLAQAKTPTMRALLAARGGV